jgi:ATP-dependent DNA ligase
MGERIAKPTPMSQQRRPGDQWLYELKLDGYRAIAFKRDGMIHLRSRNDNDFSGRCRTTR